MYGKQATKEAMDILTKIFDEKLPRWFEHKEEGSHDQVVHESRITGQLTLNIANRISVSC